MIMRPNQPLFRGGADAAASAQSRQIKTIAEGTRNGSITAGESKELLKQQEVLSKAGQEAKADGIITKEESSQLRMMREITETSTFEAINNKQRDAFAAFDGAGQRQADQLDQISKGLQKGDITHKEAGALLEQQTEIAGAREGASSSLEGLFVEIKQNQAGKDIEQDSRPKKPDFTKYIIA